MSRFSCTTRRQLESTISLQPHRWWRTNRLTTWVHSSSREFLARHVSSSAELRRPNNNFNNHFTLFARYHVSRQRFRRYSDTPQSVTLIARLTCQHFGDLITCTNWTDIWLHEGFAAYYEVKSVDAVEPDLYYVSFAPPPARFQENWICNSYRKYRTRQKDMPTSKLTNNLERSGNSKCLLEYF